MSESGSSESIAWRIASKTKEEKIDNENEISPRYAPLDLPHLGVELPLFAEFCPVFPGSPFATSDDPEFIGRMSLPQPDISIV